MSSSDVIRLTRERAAQKSRGSRLNKRLTKRDDAYVAWSLGFFLKHALSFGPCFRVVRRKTLQMLKPILWRRSSSMRCGRFILLFRRMCKACAKRSKAAMLLQHRTQEELSGMPGGCRETGEHLLSRGHCPDVRQQVIILLPWICVQAVAVFR